MTDATKGAEPVAWVDIAYTKKAGMWVVTTKQMFDEQIAIYTHPSDQSARIVELEAAIASAYGHLWHVNNEVGTPGRLYPPEMAAYEARKHLRHMLTTKQRGEAIINGRESVSKFAQFASAARQTVDYKDEIAALAKEAPEAGFGDNNN